MYIATINMNKNRLFALRCVNHLCKYCFEKFFLRNDPSSVLCLVFVSLVSHENIEIFVVIHEKAIQRSLKNERQNVQKKSLYINCRRTKTVCGSYTFLMQSQRPK